MSPVLPTPLDSGSNKYPWGYASRLVGGKRKTYKTKNSKKSRKMRKTRKSWDKSKK